MWIGERKYIRQSVLINKRKIKPVKQTHILLEDFEGINENCGHLRWHQ
jgi:hypothetical protein